MDQMKKRRKKTRGSQTKRGEETRVSKTQSVFSLSPFEERHSLLKFLSKYRFSLPKSRGYCSIFFPPSLTLPRSRRKSSSEGEANRLEESIPVGRGGIVGSVVGFGKDGISAAVGKGRSVTFGSVGIAGNGGTVTLGRGGTDDIVDNAKFAANGKPLG